MNAAGSVAASRWWREEAREKVREYTIGAGLILDVTRSVARHSLGIALLRNLLGDVKKYTIAFPMRLFEQHQLFVFSD